MTEQIDEIKTKGELKPRGIIPVDIFGQCADYDEINEIAQQEGLFVLEDAAQSFGASYKGKKACSLAPIAATSFFPAKPLGAYGDGGMVFTTSEPLHKKLLSIRVHGQGSNKYDNIRVGINGRLDTIQAAILLAKFDIFPEEISLKQQITSYYNKKLAGFVTIPYVKDYNVSAWAQYSVLSPDRNRIMKNLKEDGIPCAIYYPRPLHLQEAFANLNYNKGDFPISEDISNKIFSLPMHPYLEIKDQIRIIEVMKKQ